MWDIFKLKKAGIFAGGVLFGRKFTQTVQQQF